jgi:hypothetical protein
MEDQIVRLNEELIALREQMQAQRELQARKELR